MLNNTPLCLSSHFVASAAAITKQVGREESIKVLKVPIPRKHSIAVKCYLYTILQKKKEKLDKSIEKVQLCKSISQCDENISLHAKQEKQLRNMTELNLSTASDHTAKTMATDQVAYI